MLKDIEIENFRCFESTKIEGFERVNLIGGKNNSGKTGLLEAILLNQSPQPQTIFLLRKLRQESEEFSKAYPEKAWDSFFFNNDIEQEGEIKTNNDNNQEQIIYLNNNLILSNEITKQNENDRDKEQDLQIKYLSENYHKGSKLTIKVYLAVDVNHANLPKEMQFFVNKYSSNYKFIIVSTNENIGLQAIKDISRDSLITEAEIISILNTSRQELMSKKPIYISPSFRYASEIIIEEYSKAVFENLDNYKNMISILQNIDPLIEGIQIFSIGKPLIYLKKAHQKMLPISMFGDAINRVTEIIVRVLNNQGGIILIDEIENGIHYSTHRDFWKALFELSKELDVQIFTTTHSLEMIQAFRDIGLNYYADSGAYFEIARNPRTNNIVGIKHELEMLDYALNRSEEVRGE
ncbi:MAG: AAA family ATPase [Crocosphaera sp.]|nr:AAA family ATPase [Crocosphaera sp.]